MMCSMEEDMKRHNLGSFYRKMKHLNRTNMQPTPTILDEKNELTSNAQEYLVRWMRHLTKY